MSKEFATKLINTILFSFFSRAKDDTSTSSSNNNLAINKSAMGSGAYAGVIGAGPGLLRRRYSVPEIIMRK